MRLFRRRRRREGGVLLTQRFSSAWQALGARADGATVCAQLLAAWSGPSRHYHSRSHLEACLALFEQHRAQAKQPHEVELALWFHDAVYDSTARDNEEQSAAWATRAMVADGIAQRHADRVAALVLATKSHQAQDDDAALLLGIDLSILGAVPEVFDRFEREVREEFCWVPEDGWRKGRAAAVLKGFAQRAKLFTHPALEALEAPARANLARALARLEAPFPSVGWAGAAAMVAACAGALAAVLVGFGAHGEAVRRLPTAVDRPRVLVVDDTAEAVRALEAEGLRGATLVEIGRTAGIDPGEPFAWLPTQKVDFAVPFALEQQSHAEHVRRGLSPRTHSFAALQLSVARNLVQVLTPRSWAQFAGAGSEAPCRRVNDAGSVFSVCRVVPVWEPVVLLVSAAWFDDGDGQGLLQMVNSAKVRAPLWVVSLDDGDRSVSPQAREAAAELARTVAEGP